MLAGLCFDLSGILSQGDLNDPVQICAQVKWEAGRLKASKTLLNIMRHLLLIPTHLKVGVKVWQLVEFFVHRICILRDEDDTTKDSTKLTIEAFKKALNHKDKIVVDEKLIILQVGIQMLRNNGGCDLTSCTIVYAGHRRGSQDTISKL